jgi:hypothetical protein
MKVISVKPIFLNLIFAISFVLNLSSQGHAQIITAGDKKKLLAKEDTLKFYAQNLILDSTTADRMISDSIFTRTLVRALQIRNSFYFPFDSVYGISKLYAPDSSFRIFTWGLLYDDFYSRQRGAIQMRTRDGSMKLIPLRDVSEFTDNAFDSARGKGNWIGAIYYNIIKTEFKGKNYYTLFGIDYNNIRSTKKWIEVLSFNEKNEPVFGGPLFTFERDSLKKAPQNRVGIEYKKEARVLANYIEEVNMILVDHLVSESDEPENKWTLVPDGDNEGFKWENGKWVHVDKAFDFKIDMKGVDPYQGKPPVADPILDSKGNRDEKKLQEKSDKNRSKDGQ